MRDARRNAAHRAIGEPVILDGAEIRRRQFLRVAGLRPLDGDLGVALARKLHLCVEAVDGADVLEILLLVGGVHAQEEVVVRHLVYQDIVHEAAVLVKQAGILRLPDLQFRGVVGGGKIGQPSGFRTADLDFPHVAHVEDPHGVATARCSSITPEYCTGMSHPPKSTIFAPSARCTECNGVARRAVEDMTFQANSTKERCRTVRFVTVQSSSKKRARKKL